MPPIEFSAYQGACAACPGDGVRGDVEQLAHRDCTQAVGDGDGARRKSGRLQGGRQLGSGGGRLTGFLGSGGDGSDGGGCSGRLCRVRSAEDLAPSVLHLLKGVEPAVDVPMQGALEERGEAVAQAGFEQLGRDEQFRVLAHARIGLTVPQTGRSPDAISCRVTAAA